MISSLEIRRPRFIAEQGRHPHGLLGAIVAQIMSAETAHHNKEAIGLLGLRETDHVLDVGTGHGRSLGVIAALVPQGCVVGVDVSKMALRLAALRRYALRDRQRIRLVHAGSDALPFPDASFDRIMAVHTLYFWDPAAPHLREIARVLKPNGKFVIAFRPAEEVEATSRFPAEIYTFRDVAAVEALLNDAGFRICRIKRSDRPGNAMMWIVARTPS